MVFWLEYTNGLRYDSRKILHPSWTMTIHRLNVTSIRLKHSLLLVLVTAFLSMQWTTTHIHLAEHHDHDGGHHQHSTETHAHQLANQHSDVIDSSHHNDVVELDHQCTNAKGKYKEKPSALVIAAVFRQKTLLPPGSIELPVILNTRLNYLDRSTVYLRGPPQFS